MALVNGLKNILKPEVVLRATGDESDGVELLEESREVDMRVRVFGLPARFVAVRMAGVSSNRSLLGVGHSSGVGDGSCKQICDYLLVLESGDHTHAVFVELKKTQTKEEKPREQLRRSLPLLHYLRSVWEVESGTILDERNLSIHYSILFQQTSEKVPKEPVKPDPTPRANREAYKGITITIRVGTPVHLTSLMKD